MDADNLLFRNCRKAQGIRIAQVLLLGERKLQELLCRRDPCDARLLETGSIEVVGGTKALDLAVHKVELRFGDLHGRPFLIRVSQCVAV